MAYSVPKQWAHGDTVSHTNMQKYSDGLDAIYAKTGGAALNPAVPWPYEHFNSISFDGSFYTFVHRKRYLWFKSTGAIEDPTGLEDAISLSENQDNYGLYDLETISWLVYGALYYVTGVTAALEYE